jgi:SAM-dependent methyltransferase
MAQAAAAADSRIKAELIERFLDYLIDPRQCIDTLGRSYIDDLEHIVAENHGFDFDVQRFPDAEAQAWFERIRSEYGFNKIEDLIAYVKEHVDGLDIANLRPRTSFHGETMWVSEPAFHRLKENLDSMERRHEFQRDVSMHGVTELPELNVDADTFERYIRSDRLNPWTYLIRREIARGTLSPDDPVICIGNRWNGEILYFRQTLGLRNTVGVDLISTDPELVVAADMHRMPFEDGSIKMVFTRGTINKSYDVRLFAREIVRVLRKDGLVAVETPGPFDYGVTLLGPTDVKGWRNLLRLFRSKVQRVIYADAMEPYAYQAGGSRLVRLFIQLDKDGRTDSPHMEADPKFRLKIYELLRGHVLELRRKARRAIALAKRAVGP